MRLRWFPAFAALVCLALTARSEADDDAFDSVLPAVSAALPPAPTAVLELLPPGIRPRRSPDETSSESLSVDPSAAPPLVERVEIPSPDDGPPDRLDVEYTIRPELDERVRGILKEYAVRLGHVILLDPASGEIFSYVSTDPEVFPATRAYPTASLMKIVTAAATLHKVPAAATRDCRYVGSPYQLRKSYLKPPRRGGHVDPFWRALALSNNQCFARLAVNDVGEDLLVAEMRRVGLLESPAAQHSAGFVEPINDELDLGFLGSGLAGSFITPLGAARLAAVLAKGELVQPFWIARVRDEAGNLLEVPGRRAPRPVWLPQVTDELRELMVAVTERGTAKSAFHNRHGEPLLGSIRVAGKTGSLSGTDPAGDYHWFIGLAPAEAPRIAIAAVVVSEPPERRSAATVAAATLREIFCDDEGCEASRSEHLHARADRRNAEYRSAAAAAIAAEKLRLEELTRVYDVSDLDRSPQVVSDTGLDFPDHLLERRTRGKIVLTVNLSREGEVVDVQIESSTLLRFNDFVLGEVGRWKFTPPIRNGHFVQARTQVPLNIRIR